MFLIRSFALAAGRRQQVYNVSGGKSLPQWLSEKKKESLRKDDEFRRRIELVQAHTPDMSPFRSRRLHPRPHRCRGCTHPLLTRHRRLRPSFLTQELEFPCSSQRAKVSPDGQFLAVSGIHPPQIKVYELSQLALKFERHVLAEIVDFQACSLGRRFPTIVFYRAFSLNRAFYSNPAIARAVHPASPASACRAARRAIAAAANLNLQILSDDYSKLVLLCADRSLCFHAKFGAYFRTRLPKQARRRSVIPARPKPAEPTPRLRDNGPRTSGTRPGLPAQSLRRPDRRLCA